MRKLIDLALSNPRGVTVAMLSILVLGVLALLRIPMDVLPVYNRPAVQTLTFYSGMPAASIASGITDPMERETGQAAGMERQESRSILGASIVRNYFHGGVDPNGALTQVNSLALGEIPNLPPGTLPPVVLPYDPTGTVPACLVTVGSSEWGESALYDEARYEVRNFIMSSPGANAPVVYGGKIRAVLALVDPIKLEARHLSLREVLRQMADFNLFLPTGDAKFGSLDYAIDSNSMYKIPERMEDIPLRTEPTNMDFLGDVAQVRDTHLIQMSEVRINGRHEVYIPVFRQQGASTLQVVDHLKEALKGMAQRLSRPNINLKMVMDQSVYVRQSIRSLATEGILGAVLCSLVILVFLGEVRMTAIAVLLIPLAVLAAVVGLYAFNETVNMMTLAGLALAIGPMVDLAIVSLENTHRHMHGGKLPRDAAREGAGEVVLPELVATCSTLLVLSPLALMPGGAQFLFRPLALSVGLAMIVAFLLSMSFVPSRAAQWLKGRGGSNDSNPQEKQSRPEDDGAPTGMGGLGGRIQRGISAAIDWYTQRLDWALSRRWWVLLAACGSLLAVIVALGPALRRDFFPQVDSGAFQMFVRLPTGTRIELTDKKVGEIEDLIRHTIKPQDLELIVSDLGVWADWSSAYTPNSGPMDALVNVQLTADRTNTAQYYAALLRRAIASDPRFAGVDVAFDASGTIGAALNLGNTTPLDLRIEAKHMPQAEQVARQILQKVKGIEGIVDARILQRLDYPEFIVDVDRAKSRRLGLTQKDVMQNVVAAIKSSIQYNKNNFWFDPVSHNQYYVGVQYPEPDIKSLNTLLNVSVTSPLQTQPIPLSDIVRLRAATMAAEVKHTDLAVTVDVAMNVEGRDLGHVADDLVRVIGSFGVPLGNSTWQPYDPKTRKPIEGAKMLLTGEYGRMQEMFFNFGVGLLLAVVFIYFLMVTLLDSYLIPLVILSAVPVGLVGILPLLWITGTALNLQSLLGVIFMVGIVVSNTVLLIDFAEKDRKGSNLSAIDAIRKAAAIRARPVVMTALAAFFALVPMALALERGSEANAPLGRAVIGGLLAGLFTTLIVVPCLYSLVVRGENRAADDNNMKDEG
jgi:multidrug efflux pump subunit AcrB